MARENLVDDRSKRGQEVGPGTGVGRLRTDPVERTRAAEHGLVRFVDESLGEISLSGRRELGIVDEHERRVLTGLPPSRSIVFLDGSSSTAPTAVGAVATGPEADLQAMARSPELILDWHDRRAEL